MGIVRIPEGRTVAEGGTYYAQKKCYYQSKIYKINDKLETNRGDMIPVHFGLSMVQEDKSWR